MSEDRTQRGRPPHRPDPLGPSDERTGSPLTAVDGRDAGTWGLPSDEGQVGQHEGRVPVTFDYAAGILVGHGDEAAAQPMLPVEHMLGARVDSPRSYQLPHEATHRRYEAPMVVPIAQAAAGFTLLAPTRIGLHYVKLIACTITLSAAGTLRFVQGSNDGLNVADMSGAMAMGGAAAPPLTLPPAELSSPWLYTAPDLGFGIFTTTGLAAGFALVCYSPYDS